jgi:hypothetical protein
LGIGWQIAYILNVSLVADMITGGLIAGGIKQDDFNRFNPQAFCPGSGIITVFSPGGWIVLIIEPANILNMDVVAQLNICWQIIVRL